MEKRQNSGSCDILLIALNTINTKDNRFDVLYSISSTISSINLSTSSTIDSMSMDNIPFIGNISKNISGSTENINEIKNINSDIEEIIYRMFRKLLCIGGNNLLDELFFHGPKGSRKNNFTFWHLIFKSSLAGFEGQKP